MEFAGRHIKIAHDTIAKWKMFYINNDIANKPSGIYKTDDTNEKYEVDNNIHGIRVDCNSECIIYYGAGDINWYQNFNRTGSAGVCVRRIIMYGSALGEVRYDTGTQIQDNWNMDTVLK